MTLSINDTQQKSLQCHHSVRRYAECRCADCRCADCRYAECHYAECRGANLNA